MSMGLDQRYNASEIRRLAALLETMADVTVILYSVAGAIVGAAFGSIVGVATNSTGLFALVGLVVGLVGGALFGYGRVLWLRLQAQLALCEVAIEENTRAAERTMRSLGPEGESAVPVPVRQEGAQPSSTITAPLPIPRAADRVANERNRVVGPQSNAARRQRCRNCGVEFPFTDPTCPNCGQAVG